MRSKCRPLIARSTATGKALLQVTSVEKSSLQYRNLDLESRPMRMRLWTKALMSDNETRARAVWR